MWGYDFGWGGMLLMSLGTILWIALMVVLVWHSFAGSMEERLQRFRLIPALRRQVHQRSRYSASAMHAGRLTQQHLSRCESD